MKKLTLFSKLAFCVLLLTGCEEKPQKSSDNTEKPAGDTLSLVLNEGRLIHDGTLTQKFCPECGIPLSGRL